MPCKDHHATTASTIRGTIYGDLLSFPLAPAGSAPAVNSPLSWTPNGSDSLCIWYIISSARKAHLEIIVCFKYPKEKGYLEKRSILTWKLRKKVWVEKTQSVMEGLKHSLKALHPNCVSPDDVKSWVSIISPTLHIMKTRQAGEE